MTSLNRRRVLQALAAAPFAARVPAFAAPRAALAPADLGLPLRGNDGFNTWVPYTNELYYRLRPALAVPRDSVIRITDRQGFHPSLAALQPIWESKELAIIQGIGNPDATQQHFRDIELAFTGADDSQFYADGWVSRALAPKARASGLDAVAFDTLDIRESDPMGPFRGGQLSIVQVHYAHELLSKRKIGECVIEANARGRARLAQAVPLREPSLKTPFPTDPFGQGPARRRGAGRHGPHTPRHPRGAQWLGRRQASLGGHALGPAQIPRRCVEAPGRRHGGTARRPARDRAVGRNAGGDLR
jgi:hypothetical protein